VLEFSGQEDGDQDLEHTSLNRDDGDDTENSVRCTPSLEIPQQLEEGNHTDHGGEVRQSCHGSTESVGVRVELSISLAPD